MATTEMNEKVNGPVAAALLAGGIGSAALGLITFVFELNDKSGFADFLKWNSGVGALSGKSGLAIIIFFVAWAILHYGWKDKNINFARYSTIAIVLLLVGLVGTFPPFWHLFG
ncbi:MAG: hypothetical protein AB1750_13000 [Chloroflexota bacterium]